MIHIRAELVKDFPSEKSYRRVMVNVNRQIGMRWHTTMLANHFKRGAAQKYDHKPRTSKYLAWKKKKWASRKPLKNGQYIEGGGETDNVLTGDLRDMLLQSSVIRPFPTRVTVTMTGPRYITMRVWKANQPDKLRELQTTTVAEREELAALADSLIQPELDKL